MEIETLMLPTYWSPICTHDSSVWVWCLMIMDHSTVHRLLASEVHTVYEAVWYVGYVQKVASRFSVIFVCKLHRSSPLYRPSEACAMVSFFHSKMYTQKKKRLASTQKQVHIMDLIQLHYTMVWTLLCSSTFLWSFSLSVWEQIQE